MVTTANIATALGRSAPGEPVLSQWAMWIADAYRAIERRAEKVGIDYDSLNVTDVDFAVRQAVVAHVKHPDDTTQVDVAVDDGRTTKRYSSGTGSVSLDDWWDMLGLTEPEGSFTIRASYVADTCRWR